MTDKRNEGPGEAERANPGSTEVDPANKSSQQPAEGADGPRRRYTSAPTSTFRFPGTAWASAHAVGLSGPRSEEVCP